MRPSRNQGGWTLGLAAGTIAAYWIARAAGDGSLAAWLNTTVAAWSFAAAGSVVLLVASQGWPRFAGGFCPPAGGGVVIAGLIDRVEPHGDVNLLLPLLALGAVAIVATFEAFGWQRAIHTGRRG